MKVALTKTESRALNALRGLPEQAHMLIMCGSTTETGDALSGSDEAFEELVSSISEAIADGMLSASATRTLAKLCAKIDPESTRWLGL